MFLVALETKCDPAEVRRYGPEVAQLACAMDKRPAEIAKWRGRDRRWMLAVCAARNEALKNTAGKG